MALFRGIQEYIARDVNNIARVEDEGNIVSIEYPPQGHPILYKYHYELFESIGPMRVELNHDQ